MDQIANKNPCNRYKQIVLVMQGGGALGAYQAGAYEAMATTGAEPNWFAGISIGAINAAIMAGNEPHRRVEKLRAFWSQITSDSWFDPFLFEAMLSRRGYAWNSSLKSIFFGAPGFFKPRILPNWLSLPGTKRALSFYNTDVLRATLLRYVDFKLINTKKVRLSVGSVNIHTGNFTYFDNQDIEIGPEHIMASGALPPGFPPIEIDGQRYWDGGLVSNSPLSYVLSNSSEDTLVFQVDLFSAIGPMPETIGDVEERRKDIVYSSRTRQNTDAFRERHQLKSAISKLAARLSDKDRDIPEVATLADLGCEHKVSIVHLIYRHQGFDGPFKDFKFSQRAMQAHWSAGAADAEQTLKSTSWRTPPTQEEGIAVYDIARTNPT